MTILSPLGFATQKGATRNIATTVPLSGAVAAGQSGNVNTTVSALRKLSGIGFNQQARNFSGKGVGHVTVTLVGARGIGQAEELEGAHLNFYPDGLSGLGEGGEAAGIPDNGTQILNTGATTEVPINYEIDDLTGMRLYPSEAVESYKGWKTRKKSADKEPFRESLKHRSVTISSAKFTEQEDVFVKGGVLLWSDRSGFVLWAEGGAVGTKE